MHHEELMSVLETMQTAPGPADRITKMLTNRTPSLGDVGSAALRASSGLTTFGEELNAQRAARINEEAAVVQLLSGERKFQLEAAKTRYDMEADIRKRAADDASTDAENFITAADTVIEHVEDAEVRGQFFQTYGQRVKAAGEGLGIQGLIGIASQVATELDIQSEMKPPKIQSIYDDEGRKQKVVWDRATQRFVNVGGPEAQDEESGETERTHRGVAINADGTYAGTMSSDNSGRMWLNPAANPTQMIPLPEGVELRTPSSLDKGVMTAKQFLDLSDALVLDESSIKALSRYWSQVEASPYGWKLLADQFLGEMRTALGAERIPASEIVAMQQSGELQGLLGRFRKEVVGGGVMTEQDALRILMRLGGDVSLARNPFVVGNLLRSLMQDKYRSYQTKLDVYNRQAGTAVYARQGYEPKAGIPVPPNMMSGVGTVEEDTDTGQFYLQTDEDPSNPASWELIE